MFSPPQENNKLPDESIANSVALVMTPRSPIKCTCEPNIAQNQTHALVNIKPGLSYFAERDH